MEALLKKADLSGQTAERAPVMNVTSFNVRLQPVGKQRHYRTWYLSLPFVQKDFKKIRKVRAQRDCKSFLDQSYTFSKEIIEVQG